MRTTVTLDPEVARLLRDSMRRTGRSFKEALNSAVREGLAARRGARTRKRFRVEARPMGLRPGIDPGALNRLLDDLEVDSFLGNKPGQPQRRSR